MFFALNFPVDCEWFVKLFEILENSLLLPGLESSTTGMVTSCSQILSSTICVSYTGYCLGVWHLVSLEHKPIRWFEMRSPSRRTSSNGPCLVGPTKFSTRHVDQCSEFDVRSNFWSVRTRTWCFEEGLDRKKARSNMVCR